MNKFGLVGIIDEDPFNYQTWSGSSRYFFEALKDKGVLVDAISADAGPYKRRLAQLVSFAPNLNEWKRRYHLNTFLFKQMSKTAIEKLLPIKDKFDAILQVGAWYNILDCKPLHDKIFCSYHDGNLATQLKRPDSHYDKNARYVRRGLDYERRLYQGLDLIFPMSEWLRNSFIKDFNCPPDKVFAVGAGVNLKYIPEIISKDYSKHNILFIGIDFERKGGRVLLDAFKIVKREIQDACLTIIGPNLTDVPDGVISHGRIMKNTFEGEERLHTAYLNATIFVMPSIYEPFGIVFAEAMAHKLPCIGTKLCAMPEIIDHEKTGLILPYDDVKTIAYKIIELLRDEKTLQQFGNAGYKKYINNYTWEAVSKKIVAIINGVLS